MVWSDLVFPLKAKNESNIEKNESLKAESILFLYYLLFLKNKKANIAS
jgi:hypothetical protein